MPSLPYSSSRPIILWLFTGCFLIFTMVVVGGITRLTGSGLSITEWNVLMGTFPPLTDADWNEVFTKYQLSPQFRKVNFHMGLGAFKAIFFWEYLHRLIGRVMGIVFIVPFLYFLLKKKLNPALTGKLLIILLLGGFQGFLGWYMVKSGLVNRPSVSHYRLAAHLCTAFLTCGYIFWVVLGLIYPSADPSAKAISTPIRRFRWLSIVLLALVIVQIVFGAFVAGLHAGKAYNTFPKMGDYWIAPGVMSYEPVWLNFLENSIGVQFVHRCLGTVLLILGATLYIFYNKSKPEWLRMPVFLFLGAIAVQFTLGVITLLYAAPISLSAIHQAGGFMVFMAGVFLWYMARRVPVLANQS